MDDTDALEAIRRIARRRLTRPRLRAGAINAKKLEAALCAIANAKAEQERDRELRRLMRRHAEAQDTLRRFRLIARMMHHTVAEVTQRGGWPANEMQRLLEAAEWHFACWAEPRILFPLVEGVGKPMLALPAMRAGAAQAAHRPAQPWRKLALRGLLAAGVSARRASVIITEIAAK